MEGETEDIINFPPGSNKDPRMSALNYLLIITNQQSIIDRTPSSRSSLRKIDEATRNGLGTAINIIEKGLRAIYSRQKNFFESQHQMMAVHDTLFCCFPLAELHNLASKPVKTVALVQGILELMLEISPCSSRGISAWLSASEEKAEPKKVLMNDASLFTNEAHARQICEHLVKNLNREELRDVAHDEELRTLSFNQAMISLKLAPSLAPSSVQPTIPAEPTTVPTQSDEPAYCNTTALSIQAGSMQKI